MSPQVPCKSKGQSYSKCVTGNGAKNCAKGFSNVTDRVIFTEGSFVCVCVCVCVCGLAVADVYISEGFGLYCYPLTAIYLEVAPNRRNIFYLRYECTRRLVYNNSASLSTNVETTGHILLTYCKEPKIFTSNTKLQACFGGRWG